MLLWLMVNNIRPCPAIYPQNESHLRQHGHELHQYANLCTLLFKLANTSLTSQQ